MPKPLIDAALLAAGRAMNRAPAQLGPGHVRVAADDQTKEAEVFVYGDIGGYWNGVQAEDFAKEIAGLDVDTLNVRINSPGGGVFDGVAIYNALARTKGRVVATVEGIAASIASVILMAADEIRIVEGAHVMIHKPWSFAIGDADAMRKEGEILDGLEAGIIDIYEARTGADRKQLQDWVAAETWFGAKEAVDAGFADEMVPAKKKEKKAAHARSAMLPLFRHAPKDLLPESGDAAPAIREFERLLRDGEGLSHAQARRIAATARAFAPAPRDAEPEQPMTTPRDEGAQAAELNRLADFIRTLRS